MAKRTKRATARKTNAPQKGFKKLAKKARTTKKQAAKRPLKRKARRPKTSTKLGRSGARKSASGIMPTQQVMPQPETMIVETAQTETTVVDVIEEPVPGVFVLTEFVETNAEPEDSLNIGPESEEQ